MRVAALAGLLVGGPAIAWPAAAADSGWSARLAFEERYDDNITQLSQKDLDRLDTSGGGSGFGCGSGSTDTSGGRFTITSPDDFIAIPQVSAGARAGWLQSRPTSFGLDVSAYAYATNPIKDYQWYRITIDQPLRHAGARRTNLSASYELVPSFYLRNLRSDRTGEQMSLSPPPRREATYRKQAGQMRLEQEILPGRLRFLGTLGAEERNYNRCFDERDSRMPFLQADLVWEPFGDGRLRLRASFRRETLHAIGEGIGTIFTEDDISSRRDIWAGDARLRLGRKGRRKSLRLHYEREDRDYAAADPLDIFHFGRRDRRRYLTLGAQFDLAKGWFLTATAERDTNRSTFPGTPGSTFLPEDTTDYDESLFEIGLGYDFGLGHGGSGGRLPGPPRD